MRHGTGLIKKVPPPPPAKPPPYQKGEPDVPQTSKEVIFRRSKSTNSKSKFKLGNRLPLTSETEDLKKSSKKLIIQSFRRHKESEYLSLYNILIPVNNTTCYFTYLHDLFGS